MIGCVTADDFQPGIVPIPDSWFKPADFDDEASREGQADMLDGLDIASIFIRFESGHSTNVEIQHCPFMPDMFPLRYLIRYPWSKREKSRLYPTTWFAPGRHPWWKEPRAFHS